MSYYCPTRGAIRLNDFNIDPEQLRRDLKTFEDPGLWRQMAYGDKWAAVTLIKHEERHPLLKNCPAIQSTIDSFKAEVMNAGLAKLGPGGWNKEHRDIAGALQLGVVRLHIPIVSHPQVYLFVNGVPLYLAPGEVWNLDTTYRHRLANNSKVDRIHLIVDLQMNEHLKRMLPRADIWDVCHKFYFGLICFGKGASLLVEPRILWTRVIDLLRVRVLRRTSLRYAIDEEDEAKS